MMLTKAQAQAVYDAMCALNNVGGTVKGLRLPDRDPELHLTVAGSHLTNSLSVNRWAGPIHLGVERFAGQLDFAKAHGLEA